VRFPKIPGGIWLCAWLLVFATGAAAKGPVSFKLASIKVSGSKRYTQNEIIAASGLQVGQTASEDDFKLAVQHLGETGAFGDISYRYKYSDEGATLEFELSDNPQLVPARFDNFVWFSDQELAARFRQRVPLFLDYQLPLSGNLPDQVSDALQAMLIEHHIEGRADYVRAADGDGPVSAIIFTVGGPHILIRHVDFAGAGAEELPELQATARKLQGVEYFRSTVHVHAEKDFLPVYLRRGYLKVQFADSQPKVVQETPEETDVDVNIQVTAGLQYSFAGATWSGNKVFPAEKLQPLLHLQTGKPANAVELDEDLQAVQELYGSRGYMAATVRPIPQLDHAHSTVAYQLKVQEGEVYKMGELEIRGVDRHATDRLSLAWRLRDGDVYDSSYPKQFLHDAAASILDLNQWNTSVHETVDPKTKTVDVSLRFDPRPLK
jgi:outer membrane protein assembly factor BamA